MKYLSETIGVVLILLFLALLFDPASIGKTARAVVDAYNEESNDDLVANP